MLITGGGNCGSSPAGTPAITRLPTPQGLHQDPARLQTRPVRVSCAGTGPAAAQHDTDSGLPVGCH